MTVTSRYHTASPNLQHRVSLLLPWMPPRNLEAWSFALHTTWKHPVVRCRFLELRGFKFGEDIFRSIPWGSKKSKKCTLKNGCLEDFSAMFFGGTQASNFRCETVKFQEADVEQFHESSELIFLCVFFFHGRPWVSFFGISGAFLR